MTTETRAPAQAADEDVQIPRYLSSYQARRAYRQPVQHPPYVNDVKDVIDVHCHAHGGQQDPLDLAKYASQNAMGGILYKTIVGRERPAEALRKVMTELHRWCDETGTQPIKAWAGFNIGATDALATPEEVRFHIEDGVACIWMPTARHANTINKIGGPPIWWDKSADPRDHTQPLPWEQAVKVGHYLLDDQGQLKAGVREIFHIIADKDVAVSFAHSTHPEIEAMAEQVDRLGIKRAFVDHPFSPFVNLSPDQMRHLADAGIFLNFTYDELSPLLGVDPALMAKTIRALGTDMVTLSSDAGEPLFPNSVEAMRLIRGHMRAFGLSEAELERTTISNPGKLVGIA